MAGQTKQVVLDFQKMTKSGLLPLAKKFQRHKLEVVEIEATNKPKRESGMQIKDATLVFADGQKVLVKVKNDGTVFQVKLNNKVLPLKHVGDLDRAIIEVVDFLNDNAKQFAKAQEKRAVKASMAEKKVTIRSTRAELIDKLTAHVSELQAERENLTRTTGESGSQLATLQEKLAEMQAKLAELVARGNELETELETLKEAA